MNFPHIRPSIMVAVISAGLCLGSSVATAEAWHDPGALLDRIVQRAPSIESSRLRAESLRQMGAAAGSQLADTTLQVTGSVLPIETRNGPIRAQVTAMQQLPQFRARASREAMYGHDADSVDCAIANDRLELRVAALQRLVSLSALDKIQQALDELKRLALDAVDTTIDGSAHDMAEHSDVLQAELVVHEIENRQLQVQRQIDEHHAVLAVWAGDPDLAIAPDLLRELYQLSDADRHSFDSDSPFESHPSLAAFVAARESSETRADALDASARTQIAFMAQWSILTGLDEADPEREGRDALSLGLSLTLPTSNREARLAAEAARVDAEANVRARQAALERLQAQAAELAERHANMKAEWQHIEGTLIPVASDRVEALVDELAHGRSSYDNLLSALETNVRLIIDQWQTWSSASQALVQLDATLNGTFSLTPWHLGESCSAVANGGEPQ